MMFALKNCGQVVVFFLGLGMLFAWTPGADALSPEAEARREERRLEREARRAERDARREARRLEREEKEAEDEGCDVDVDLKWQDPSLHWVNGKLVMTPHVDVEVKSKGDFQADNWEARLSYSGSSHYESRDVEVPSGVIFSGDTIVMSGFCGLNYEYKNMSLPSVLLSGIGPDLVDDGEKLKGEISFLGELTAGADKDKDDHTEKFTIRDGNL